MLDLFFRKYAWTANLALIFAAAWLAAKTVNTLVGALIRPRPRAELSAVAPAPPRAVVAPPIDDAKLYHLIGVEPPQQAESEAQAGPARPQNCKDPRAEPQRTQLRLQLVASVLADHPRWSLATIADLGTRETHVLGVGDRIQGAELLAVERVRAEADPTGNAVKVVAILCNGGTKEYLDYDASAGAVASGATPNLGVEPVPRPGVPGAPLEGVRTVGRDRYEIDRKVIDSTLNNLNNIATQARIVPSFKNGVANGFKLFSIQPGSLYSSIGIENGDVIQRVNGYEINSPEKALELYQKLRESGHVTIELERQGQTVRKEYNITGP
ncbi:MAG TPA: type II secretion system protein GspC [Anaeromyxobacteraceae bacterium]|nr:type II secretion system protein GspC [Anaeromyxobacteraceae bacterium]